MTSTRAARAATSPPNGGSTTTAPSSAMPEPTSRPRSPYRAGKRRAAEANLVETAAIAGSFTTLAAAVRAAGLVDALSASGPFTMFAPTDDAFTKLTRAELDALLADKAALTRVLTHHVVPEVVKAPTPGSPTAATTLNGSELTITAKDRGFRVNGARVVKTQIRASNGVIHAIDTVLMPR
jgi:uncharacterized surface protein with fasciclin (FAS1) repeats